MKNFKNIIIVIIAILMTVSMTACSAGTPIIDVSQTPEQNEETGNSNRTEPVTLKALTFSMLYKDGLKEVEKELTKDTGITLELAQVPDGEQGNVIFRTRFATNELPDLMFFYSGYTDIRKFGFDLFVDQAAQEWTKNFDKQMWESHFSADGKWLQAPYGGSHVLGVLYNKKVFTELDLSIPRTYDEFIRVCEKVKAAGKVPYYISGKDGWTTMLTPWLAGTGEWTAHNIEALNMNKMRVQDLALLKDGLVKLLEIKKKGYINGNYLSATYDNAQKALASGEAAMYCNLTMTMNEITSKYPDKVDDIGLFAMPFAGDDKDVIGITPPYAIMILKGDNQDNAQRFVNYFESVDIQNKYFSMEGGVPAIKGVTRTRLSSAALDGKAYMDKGQGYLMWNIGLRYGFGDFGALTQELLIGAKTPDQVLESVDKEFRKNAKAAKDSNFN